MVINLFEKGTGIKNIQELYNLTNADVDWLQDKLFDYETKPLTTEEIEENIQVCASFPGTTKEELDLLRRKMLDRNHLTRWVKEDASEIFFDRFHDRNLSDVKFTLKHIAAVIDDGDAFRKNGLRKVTDLLIDDSPLYYFLAENGVEINPYEKWIKIRGELYCLDEDRFSDLRVKFYYWKGETEAFICGEPDEIINYSCIGACPEILATLDNCVYKRKSILQWEWYKKRTKTLCLEFDVGLDEMIIAEVPDSDPHKVSEWIIRMCLINMCQNETLPEKYAALKGNIEPKRLRITEVVNTRKKTLA